ncbi:lipase-like PAD4 [Cocos nucifera]|uniref:Lipase-like PAD4 n=1 Tax=Cocos nucifera TaxID=13894 RepID=A0A8K0ND45_COCNU|nr:lipase-like PAD4 [Cocos nucifera]
MLGALLASSSLLARAWSQCMRANAGGSSFTLERCDDTVYVAFSGVQTGELGTHRLVPIGSGGHGLFSPLVGVEVDGSEPVLVHATFLHVFLALFCTNEFQKPQTTAIFDHLAEKFYSSPLLGNEALSRAVRRERWCVARPTSAMSDQEKAGLHALISMHIDAAATEQEISAATQQRSPYWPFGNYALCSAEGVVVFDNPLVVVRMLHSTFMTGSSIEEEHLSYGDLFATILENLLLKKRNAIEEAPESNFFAGISLALEASGIGNQDMGALKARRCLKMSKRMGCSPNLIGASLAIKLGKITPWRAQIEWYKASCDDDMGYYDSFKLRKFPKKDSRTNMNRHRLAKFWDDLIDMLQKNQLPHDFHKRGKWVNAAQFYKLLVEPLDIAEYYRVQMHKKKGHYLTQGRERRYQVFDRWWRDRKKNSYEGENSKRSKLAGLTQDSCFWAKVEMAKEWLEDARSTESDRVEMAQILENLKGFESYSKQMVERKEVSIDVLAPRSSYTLWVEEWKVLQSNLALQIAP